MLKSCRQKIIKNLWENHSQHSSQVKAITTALKQKDVEEFILDHFAIIDLPGPHTGIPTLRAIFSALGYQEQGRDYLADKQNDFLWMAECDSHQQPVCQVLPQVVVADFRLSEMPNDIQAIIEKYAQQATHPPLTVIQKLIEGIKQDDDSASKQLQNILLNYFQGRDWPLPACNEFYAVREWNELLAWVLIFGRRPNHFTLSVHLLNHFTNLAEFNHFIATQIQLPLNSDGGTIKGGPTQGLAQSSTQGTLCTVNLADGSIELPSDFVEFIWRYPHTPTLSPPLLWGDYFTGFVAQFANRVIESLYVDG